MLSANPTYLFFHDATPELFPKQARAPAAEALIKAAERDGLLTALWPSVEPEIAATWAATFCSAGGLALTPVVFEHRQTTSAPLFSAATARLAGTSRSLAVGMGRTVMTTLSARLATMAQNVDSIQDISWLARFAAIIEIMRLSNVREARISIAKDAWRSLAGDVACDIE